MSRDNAFLLDILLMAKDAVELVNGMTKDDFISDRKSHSAVIRCLEVIGEAIKRLSDDFQKKNPEIPWSRMAMRGFLIHAQGRVNLDEVWDTVQNDLPRLISFLESTVPPED